MRKVDAPIPARFTLNLERKYPPVIEKKYNSALFDAQLEEVDGVTDGIKDDIKVIEAQLEDYISTVRSFNDILPRIKYIIENIRRLAQGALEDTAKDFQAALDELLKERDALFNDQPRALDQLKKLNQMQRDFLNALYTVAEQLPAPVAADQEIESYLYDQEVAQPDANAMDVAPVVTSRTTEAAPPTPIDQQDFWAYWKIMVIALQNRLQQDPTYRLESDMSPSARALVRATMSHIFGNIPSSESKTLESLIIGRTSFKPNPLPPRECVTEDAVRLAGYPRLLIEVDPAKKCLDKLTYASGLLQYKNGAPLTASEKKTVTKAGNILHVYTMLARKLGMPEQNIYKNIVLERYYNTVSAPHSPVGFVRAT